MQDAQVTKSLNCSLLIEQSIGQKRKIISNYFQNILPALRVIPRPFAMMWNYYALVLEFLEKKRDC